MSPEQKAGSELIRLFSAAQFGDDEVVTTILREMDRQKRKEWN